MLVPGFNAGSFDCILSAYVPSHILSAHFVQFKRFANFRVLKSRKSATYPATMMES
jgi:hypothetical protein